MEAADDAPAFVSPAGRLVVSGKDRLPRTSRRAKDCGLTLRQQILIAEHEQSGWRIPGKPAQQHRGI
jgi:hypothetical protein